MPGAMTPPLNDTGKSPSSIWSFSRWAWVDQMLPIDTSILQKQVLGFQTCPPPTTMFSRSEWNLTMAVLMLSSLLGTS
jgi:hypothetical protein